MYSDQKNRATLNYSLKSPKCMETSIKELKEQVVKSLLMISQLSMQLKHRLMFAATVQDTCYIYEQYTEEVSYAQVRLESLLMLLKAKEMDCYHKGDAGL